MPAHNSIQTRRGKSGVTSIYGAPIDEDCKVEQGGGVGGLAGKRKEAEGWSCRETHSYNCLDGRRLAIQPSCFLRCLMVHAATHRGGSGGQDVGLLSSGGRAERRSAAAGDRGEKS